MKKQDCCHSDNKMLKIDSGIEEHPDCRCSEDGDSDSRIESKSGCEESSKVQLEACAKDDNKNYWIVGEIKTPVGMVPQISTELVFRDTIGMWKVRWGINRMNYKINPGLYGVGVPDENAPVLVTANYKLSFDSLRKELSGIDAWLLVLDTKGINVWCAAGKGTFGTQELIKQIAKTRLSEIVSHQKLIVPQLGAPGIESHEISRKSGFSVIYGPVRTNDIQAFIHAGMKATVAMRAVNFNWFDRLILTPIELVGTIKPTLMIFGVLFLLNLITKHPFGLMDVLTYLGAIIIGCLLTPLLLPIIPGRSFAWKGWMLGFIWVVSVMIISIWGLGDSINILKLLSYLFIFPSIASYYALNFTGASTFTSFSGVQKEMRIAIPILIVLTSSGIVLMLINSFFTF